jgi:hypothetical protein
VNEPFEMQSNLLYFNEGTHFGHLFVEYDIWQMAASSIFALSHSALHFIWLSPKLLLASRAVLSERSSTVLRLFLFTFSLRKPQRRNKGSWDQEISETKQCFQTVT